MENQTEIEDLKEQIQELETKKKLLEEGDCEDMYDDMLDDCYPDVTVCNMTYTTSQVLKAVDEIAYNCGYNDWADGEISELDSEIDDLKDQIKELENEEADSDE